MSEEENSEETSSGGSSGGMMRLVPLALISVIVGLVASVAGGAVFWVLLSRSGVLAQMQPQEQSEELSEEGTAEQEAFRLLMENAGILDLEPFVVNLADTEEPRYLRVKITLMVDDKTVVEEVIENATMVSKARDVILQTLSRKTSDEILNEEGRSILRAEILEGLAPYFHEPKVVDVMFTEFVIQL